MFDAVRSTSTSASRFSGAEMATFFVNQAVYAH